MTQGHTEALESIRDELEDRVAELEGQLAEARAISRDLREQAAALGGMLTEARAEVRKWKGAHCRDTAKMAGHVEAAEAERDELAARLVAFAEALSAFRKAKAFLGADDFDDGPEVREKFGTADSLADLALDDFPARARQIMDIVEAAVEETAAEDRDAEYRRVRSRGHMVPWVHSISELPDARNERRTAVRVRALTQPDQPEQEQDNG